MKRTIGLVVAAAILVGAIGVGVTLLVHGRAPNGTAPKIIAAMRTKYPSLCPEHPAQPAADIEKVVAPVQAKSGDWYVGCEATMIIMPRSQIVPLTPPLFHCYRVRADSLEVTSIVTAETMDDGFHPTGYYQSTPCTTIPEWPKP